MLKSTTLWSATSRCSWSSAVLHRLSFPWAWLEKGALGNREPSRSAFRASPVLVQRALHGGMRIKMKAKKSTNYVVQWEFTAGVWEIGILNGRGAGLEMTLPKKDHCYTPSRGNTNLSQPTQELMLGTLGYTRELTEFKTGAGGRGDQCPLHLTATAMLPLWLFLSHPPSASWRWSPKVLPSQLHTRGQL